MKQIEIVVDGAIKKDYNRNLKVYCPDLIKCGFKFNTSASQIKKVIDKRGAMCCPNCDQDMILPYQVR